jgi:hypothetical protein
MYVVRYRLHLVNTLAGVLTRPNTAQNTGRGVKPLRFPAKRGGARQYYKIRGKSVRDQIGRIGCRPSGKIYAKWFFFLI